MHIVKRYYLDGQYPVNTGKLSTATSLKGKTELSIQLALRLLRVPTGKLRLLPNFLIIGAQKCGTTSLYNYLTKHPHVYRSWFKEIHFFDRRFNKGVNWYRSHFPLKIHKTLKINLNKKPFFTGEASPEYLFYPYVAERVYSIVPEIKIIILLRNPVDRAFSHYNHEFRRGREYLAFDKAIKLEKKRINRKRENILKEKNFYNFIYDHFTYCTKGIYVEQLDIWKKIFPSEQILIINSETFFRKPQRIYNKVLKFLGLSEYRLEYKKKFNVGKYKSKMNKKIREELITFFKPHNQRLFDLIGERYDWDK